MQFEFCREVPVGGAMLAVDVYRPDGPGPFPTILVRTPYHRTGSLGAARPFVERGYAFVIEDCRGKYDSGGEFRPLRDEAEDGRATLDWVAEQRWCNGRIGMWGRSYLGIVQVPAASGGHEALRCMAPSVAPGSFFRDWVRYDGCFALGNAGRWALTHASSRTQPPLQHFTWDELCGLASPEEIAARVGFPTPALVEWAEHDAYDSYWEEIDQTRMHAQIAVPGLHAGGWFDHLTRGQFEAYGNIRDRGGSELARTGQRLLIGPWGHTNTGNRGGEHCRYGEWDFGPAADFPLLEHELDFMDLYLREMDNGFADRPPVELFLIGANRWVGLDDWPPPGGETQRWYLDSSGGANMRSGRLDRVIPERSAADSYAYDPGNPVPTRGGQIYWGLQYAGPASQFPVVNRSDVVYYRSCALERPLAAIGEVELELTITSDAEDTDFIARLCVEESSGTITCLNTGSLRCRYRNSWSEPEPLKPGELTAIKLRLGQIGCRFPAGSRIGLMITSSDFPRILPHPNSMAPTWREKKPVVARNAVLHGPATPSCLSLPVVDLD